MLGKHGLPFCKTGCQGHIYVVSNLNVLQEKGNLIWKTFQPYKLNIKLDLIY